MNDKPEPEVFQILVAERQRTANDHGIDDNDSQCVGLDKMTVPAAQPVVVGTAVDLIHGTFTEDGDVVFRDEEDLSPPPRSNDKDIRFHDGDEGLNTVKEEVNVDPSLLPASSNVKKTKRRQQFLFKRSNARRNVLIPWTTVESLQNVPTNKEELRHVHGVHGEESWQARILEFLHHKWTQRILMGLLLLDVLVLFVELFLAAEFPSCHIISRDALSCCPISLDQQDEQDNNHMMRFLSIANGAHESSLCEEGYSEEFAGAATCDSHKYPALHQAHNVLFGMTMGILSCFLVELTLLCVCLGIKTFCRHSFYVLDVVVVTSSFVLELVFHLQRNDAAATAAGFIVLGRLWRFVRIGHGLIEATVELTSYKQEKLLDYIVDLETILTQHAIPIPVKGKTIQKLMTLQRSSHHPHLSLHDSSSKLSHDDENNNHINQ